MKSSALGGLVALRRSAGRWLGEHGLFAVWCGLGALLLVLVANPVDAAAQLVLGLLAVVVLLVFKRFQLRGVARLFFLFLAAYVSLRYWCWRTMTTVVFHEPISFTLAVALYVAELYGIVVYLLGIFVNIHPLERQPVELTGDPQEWPTVDVLIPTYNEPTELIEVTMRAALRIDYPKERFRVCLCDDGGTEQKRNDKDPRKAEQAFQRNIELKALCRRLGASYLTRARNLHAKAGNINSALMEHTSGELILILDTDHVPTTDILKNTVGWHLRDPKMFLVQTPHFFLNPDPIERNLGTWDSMPSENEMFYRVIQKGLDFWGASFFCGSAALLRRKFLMEVGGIAGETITEDAETALGLHARGYHSAYIARPMISGLSPETFGGFILQRTRWAQGMVQIFLLKNPLRLKGLRLYQRLCYVNSCFFWFFPYTRIAFLLAPLALLFFGLRIFDAGPVELFAYTVPHVAAVILTSHFLFGHVRWSWVSELYELMQSFYCLPAIIEVFMKPRAPTFNVTPKGETLDRDFISPLAKPFYVVLALTVVAPFFGIQRILTHPKEAYSVIVSLFWTGLNLILLLSAIGALLERKQRRATPRMAVAGTLELLLGGQTLTGGIGDISLGGVGAVLDAAPAGQLVGERGRVRLKMATGEDCEFHVLVRSQRLDAGKPFLGVEFEHRSGAEASEKVSLVTGHSQRWITFQERREQKMGVWRSLLLLAGLGLRFSTEHFWKLLVDQTTAAWLAVKRALASVRSFILKPELPFS